MDFILQMLQFILHIDEHLSVFIQNYGVWTYAILFIIIFCETGLVVAPFLPGDSLLFATGALAATTALNVHFVVPFLIIAALLGDTVNYTTGHFMGARLFASSTSRLFNKRYLEKAHAFYEQYGAKAIIIARFVPIIRTFVPFVAGVAAMGFVRFIKISCFAAFFWVSVVTYAGYCFGTLPFIRDHFSFVVIGVIVISLTPILFEFIKSRFIADRL